MNFNGISFDIGGRVFVLAALTLFVLAILAMALFAFAAGINVKIIDKDWHWRKLPDKSESILKIRRWRKHEILKSN